MRRLLLGLTLLFACDSSTSSGPDANPDPTGDGGPGELCGGIAGLQCAETEYCDWTPNNCGIADFPGVCRPRPRACPAVIGPPLCGCDGLVHPGECPLYDSGTDLDEDGGCPVDSTRFKCGYAQCELATEYCRKEMSAGVETFTCVRLPLACGTTATCTCLRSERCGASCTGEGKDGLTVTCS
jgi:hypothetical protein